MEGTECVYFFHSAEQPDTIKILYKSMFSHGKNYILLRYEIYIFKIKG